MISLFTYCKKEKKKKKGHVVGSQKIKQIVHSVYNKILWGNFIFFPFLGKNITVYKIILLKVKIQYFFFSKQIYVQYTFLFHFLLFLYKYNYYSNRLYVLSSGT